MSNPIVSFDEQAVKDELRELVRKTIEETIDAMYLAGASTRRIEDVSKTLRGAGVSVGMVGSIAEVFPDVKYQRCTVHFYRTSLPRSPNPSAPRSRPCSRQSTRWSPERHRRPRRSRWPATWN